MFFKGNDVSSNYEQIISMLKQMMSDINSTILSPEESLILKNIAALNNDYPGYCQVYCLLNDYFVGNSVKKISSNFDKQVLNQLEKLHKALANDSCYNWFGTPRVDKLIAAGMYGGEQQFGQRMQVMIANTAQHAINARMAIQPQLEKILQEMGPLDNEFLGDYVSARLSPKKIKLLDKLDNLLWEYSADFITIQTALHFYRFIIAAICKSKNETKYSAEHFINPRSAGMPLKRMHPELGKDALVERLLFLIPEGELKSFFLMDKNNNEKELESFLTRYFDIITDSAPDRMWTPLSSSHYQVQMKKILEEMKIEAVNKTISGYLPYYRGDKPQLLENGKIFIVKFSNLIFEQFIGYSIENNSINDMSPHENWAGQSIHRHFYRLYTISLLTNHPGVAKEAWCRLEWWYYNVTPYFRGSACIGEAIGKTLQLSHHILPTQMRDISPDLRAICQCDEENYAKNYDGFFCPSQYPLPLPMSLNATVANKSLEQNEEGTSCRLF